MKRPLVSEVFVGSVVAAFLVASACGDPDASDFPYEGKATQRSETPIRTAVEDDQGYGTMDGTDVRGEHPFVETATKATSRLPLDVGAASYSKAKRRILAGRLPNKESVRVEQFVNAFAYDYAAPAVTDEHPFLVHAGVGTVPWSPGRRLVRIAVKAAADQKDRRPPVNLAFLVDVSGSMADADKLPLLKSALRRLATRLGPNDRIALVTYAGTSGIALPSTPGDQRDRILAAIDGLTAGGASDGRFGIVQAYEVAEEGFLSAGINRVVLCTDGDFALTDASPAELDELVRRHAEAGTFLTALGFGTEVAESNLAALAEQGDGNSTVIDVAGEADAVLERAVTATLVTVAKEVELSVEFHPELVRRHRLIGFDFDYSRPTQKQESVGSGEVRAGQALTALFEIEPESELVSGEDLATVRILYKTPGSETRIEMETGVTDGDPAFADASADFRFAAAAAAFAMNLKGSANLPPEWDLAHTRALAAGALGSDPNGYRAELVDLIDRAAMLAP